MGKHWLGFREDIILIQVSSELRSARLRVIMADFGKNSDGEVEQRIGLTMNFTLNIRYRMKDEDKVLSSMMKDMNLRGVDEINVQQMYEKYGFMIVGRVGREVLGQYTPEEVLDNLPAINATLQQDIQKAFEKTPLIASSVSLGPVVLPQVITDRINANKDAELSIAEKRAQQDILMLEKRNEIELAKQQAVKEKVDALSLAEQNRILAKSVTPEVIKLRELDIRSKEIEMLKGALPDAKTVFVPYGAVDSVGAQTRMFK